MTWNLSGVPPKRDWSSTGHVLTFVSHASVHRACQPFNCFLDNVVGYSRRSGKQSSEQAHQQCYRGRGGRQLENRPGEGEGWGGAEERGNKKKRRAVLEITTEKKKRRVILAISVTCQYCPCREVLIRNDRYWERTFLV